MVEKNHIRSFDGQPITHAMLMNLLHAYRQPLNKIQQLEEKGVLSHVKRGLYVAGPTIRETAPSDYVLANHIYGPSYVSLETALAYWGLIPEAVAAISSMTTGTTREFRTPHGFFQYKRLRLPYYSFGIRQVEITPNQHALMASPEKALCDTIINTARVILRSPRQTLQFLEEDLRIELDALRQLDANMIRKWERDAPKRGSISMFIKTLYSL